MTSLCTQIACTVHRQCAFEVPGDFGPTMVVPCPWPGCKRGLGGDEITTSVARGNGFVTSVTLARRRDAHGFGDWIWSVTGTKDWDMNAVDAEMRGRAVRTAIHGGDAIDLLREADAASLDPQERQRWARRFDALMESLGLPDRRG